MNNYREKIERYSKNEMSEAEAQSFEHELKDISALFDYLMENVDADAHAFSEDIGLIDLIESEQKVKRKVKKRLFSLIVSITLIVLLIVGSSFIIVPNVINHLNYNPLQGQVLSDDGLKRVEKPSNFELYNRIENQIFPEEDRLVATSIDRIGAGKYSIQKEFYNDFRGSRSATKEIMDRGIIEPGISDSTNDLSLIYGNKNDIETNEIVSEDSVLNKKIALLPDSSWVKLTLTFANPKSWNELQAFMRLHEDVVFHSSIVENRDPLSAEIGIRLTPEFNDSITTLTAMQMPYSNDFVTKIEKEYPQLLSQITKTSAESQVRLFLKSNIQYLIDHLADDVYQDTLSDREESKSEESQFESLKEKIESENLSFSKIQVSMPKEMFSQIVEENEFFYATLDDISLFN